MALKNLILGYRKITGKSIDELARELEVPKTVVEGLENGEIKHEGEGGQKNGVLRNRSHWKRLQDKRLPRQLFQILPQGIV